MDWDVYLRIVPHFPAVLINEFLAVSREYQDTKTSQGGLEPGVQLRAGGIRFNEVFPSYRESNDKLTATSRESVKMIRARLT